MIAGPIFEGLRVLWSHRREARQPIIHTGMSFYTTRMAAVFFFVCACIQATSHFAGGWTCHGDLKEQFYHTWCGAQKNTQPAVPRGHPGFEESTFMYFRWGALNLFFIAFSFGITASVWTTIEGKIFFVNNYKLFLRRGHL